MRRELAHNTMHKGTNKGLLGHSIRKWNQETLKKDEEEMLHPINMDRLQKYHILKKKKKKPTRLKIWKDNLGKN